MYSTGLPDLLQKFHIYHLPVFNSMWSLKGRQASSMFTHLIFMKVCPALVRLSLPTNGNKQHRNTHIKSNDSNKIICLSYVQTFEHRISDLPGFYYQHLGESAALYTSHEQYSSRKNTLAGNLSGYIIIIITINIIG